MSLTQRRKDAKKTVAPLRRQLLYLGRPQDRTASPLREFFILRFSNGKTCAMVVTIRPYDPNDFENTVQLWHLTWHQTFPKIEHPQPYSAWKARFRNDFAVRGNIWVAEVENCIVGFAVVFKHEQYLSQIFVDSLYQHRGIGSALVNKAKEICPQGLTLQTLRQNLQACMFYEKHGFKAGKLTINKINGQPNIEYHWTP